MTPSAVNITTTIAVIKASHEDHVFYQHSGMASEPQSYYRRLQMIKMILFHSGSPT
jgi:hypothetical protein